MWPRSHAAVAARTHSSRKHLWAVSEALVPRKRIFDFNQALMDLGAMDKIVAAGPRAEGPRAEDWL